MNCYGPNCPTYKEIDMPDARPHTAFCSDACKADYYPEMPAVAEKAPVGSIHETQLKILKKTSIPPEKYDLYLRQPDLLLEPHPTEPPAYSARTDLDDIPETTPEGEEIAKLLVAELDKAKDDYVNGRIPGFYPPEPKEEDD